MEKYIHILKKRSTGNLLVLLIILTFTVLAIIRLYPFKNELQTIVDGPDDWRIYARFALDIKHNGILMPSLYDNYYAPAGFLYNYFLALCFTIFGENTVPVYILQSFLLGLSITFTYWAFRDKMKPLTGILFLFTLFIFGLVDINKYYSFRFLSENIALFTVTLFFYCFFKGIEKNKLWLQLLAAVFMGLSISIRPNIFPFAFVLIALVLFYSYKRKEAILKKPLLFILLLILFSSLLVMRNYFTCGGLALVPTQGAGFGEYYFNPHGFSFSFFIKKILFCLGIFTPLEPEYLIRPHWTLMWIGYFIYLFYRFKNKIKWEIWESTTHLFIFFFYLFIFMLAPQLGTYGFRLFVPVIFLVLPFGFIGVDGITEKRNELKQ